ncbi:MAG TPA: hypothetical protein VF699_01490 [Caulobacteraceae bacterium]|jgi:hypothetical protein
MNRRTIAAVAALLTLVAGGAYAADAAGMMDCCKACPCCKDKAPAPKDSTPAPAPPPHQH